MSDNRSVARIPFNCVLCGAEGLGKAHNCMYCDACKVQVPLRNAVIKFAEAEHSFERILDVVTEAYFGKVI